MREKRFCITEITEADLAPGGSGVRAQAMTPAGDLVQDFEIIERPDALHLLNAPSPAATAALAIGEEIVRRVPRDQPVRRRAADLASIAR